MAFSDTKGKEMLPPYCQVPPPWLSFYTRSGIPWYWAEMCLPAPICLHWYPSVWEAPPYCYLSGHPDTTETEVISFLLENGRSPHSVLGLFDSALAGRQSDGIIPGWGQKFMLQCGLHRHCGCMYERVAHHGPAEINIPVSYFFLWYYYFGRCWAVLLQPDDNNLI